MKTLKRAIKRELYFILILFILSGGGIRAQIVTDRPDQTESSSTVGLGNLQIESGILFGYESNGSPAVRRILFPSSLFRYGLTGAIEIRLLNQLENVKAGNAKFQGIGDMEAGAKFVILDGENGNTQIAFLSHLLMPTGTRDISAGRWGTINKLSLSHQINEKTGLGYNLGYNYFGSDRGDLTWSASLGIGINQYTGIYIEPYGEWVNLAEVVLNFDAGMTYLVRDNLQLDFSFGTGVNQRMNYLSAGFSWLISRQQE